MTIKNKHIMGHTQSAVTVRCPQCRRSYMRVYKEYDNGFGFCVDHPTIRVVRASRLLEDSKVRSRTERIKAELEGQRI